MIGLPDQAQEPFRPLMVSLSDHERGIRTRSSVDKLRTSGVSQPLTVSLPDHA